MSALTTTTTAAPTTTAPTTTVTPATPGRARLHRLLAAGGAAFAVIVLAQNVLRGSSAPLNDASVTDVLEYYRDDTGLALALAAMFVVGGLCLAGFIAELGRRLFRRGTDVWASIGVIGGVWVIGMFSVVVAAESALVGAAGRTTPDLGTIDAVWLFHNATFSILDLALATALLGLGRASSAAGLAPRFFGWLAPVGAAALCFSAAATPVIADGTAVAAMGPALAGFATWLLFLLTTSTRMVRSEG